MREIPRQAGVYHMFAMVTILDIAFDWPGRSKCARCGHGFDAGSWISVVRWSNRYRSAYHAECASILIRNGQL